MTIYIDSWAISASCLDDPDHAHLGENLSTKFPIAYCFTTKEGTRPSHEDFVKRIESLFRYFTKDVETIHDIYSWNDALNEGETFSEAVLGFASLEDAKKCAVWVRLSSPWK